eukprot:5909478-Pyramimonas_sp.AAC.1
MEAGALGATAAAALGFRESAGPLPRLAVLALPLRLWFRFCLRLGLSCGFGVGPDVGALLGAL